MKHAGGAARSRDPRAAGLAPNHGRSRPRTLAVCRAWGVACGLLAIPLLASCFYDSRWGESKRLQQAAARRATPHALRPTEGTGEDPASTPVRTVHVRARATSRYAAEVVDWRRQLATLLDDANRVLAGTLSVRLELTETAEWAARGDEQDLEQMLAELSQEDPADGADLVMGLVGSVPRVEMSFHQLGVANRPGKHLVMRAMSDARELDAIQKDLKELPQADREKLYSARKRHKTTTVLLHELAHALGVIHQRGANAIMALKYSSDAEQYGSEATEWMRATLRNRGLAVAGGEPSLEETVIGVLQRAPDLWVASERDELLQRLLARRAPAAPPVASKDPGGPPQNSGSTPSSPLAPVQSGQALTGTGLPGLDAAEQALFARAEADERAGKHAEAYGIARPLFMKYPALAAVQDLRCRLAMQLHADDWDVAQAECASFMKLQAGQKK